MTRITALFALFFSLLPGFSSAERGVTVFAAASLGGVLEEIATSYGGEVRLSVGGSGTMARQAASGAPADVIVLANTLWMDWLIQQPGWEAAEATYVAANRLVLVGPAEATPLTDVTALPDRLGTGRLAMGQRDAVPAGVYARQWLEAAGQWDDVNTRLAETDNVRAALALVARGETPLGVVYATDAAAEPRVRVLWEVSEAQHDPILYPATSSTDAGAAFLAHLKSARAADIFARHGFLPVTE